MKTSINRRAFLKKMALGAAAATAASLVPGVVFGEWRALDAEGSDIQWRKTPCRFCGVGCGLLVGLAQGRAVAVKGDPDSPVNRGLCCVKGYHSVQALYGEDRLQKALVRRGDEMVEVPIGEALDLVAAKMRETIDEHGKDAVSIYGSGQWTIPDGYVASKLFKGAIGTNNVEANARLCMASAVTGFLTSFGLDEPMGCYEDIDHADIFVLWGNNMAEMHPVLFSRMLDRRLKDSQVKIIDLGTRTTRTSQAADQSFLFKPQTDLALANAICYELLRNNWVDWDFVERHVAFKKGKTDIGYGLEEHFAFQDKAQDSSREEFQRLLADYAPEKVEALTGIAAADIRYLASLYGDPSRKVMSLWCMGMNQHTRGTWINNLVYNIHLLTGKISQPGNSPFSLTGQPSACGTVREVGTLTHKLPHGVVMNPKHRALAAKIWKVPEKNIDPKPSHHTVSMFRALDRGDIRFMWIQVTNPMVTMPNLRRYRDGAQKEGRFIVVSEIYPTPTTDIADVVLPAAMWFEQEGLFGNSERRTQHFDQLIEPPGEAMSDTWQLIEVARRLGYGELFPWSYEDHIREIWAEYRQFHAGAKHEMAPYEELRRRPGIMWPYVEGKETRWRYNAQYDPAADPGRGYDFYGKPDHRAWIWLRPYEPAAESPSAEFPFWLNTGRVLEHWHTGTMTRRVPTLHRAVPEAYVELHPADARRLGIAEGEKVRLVSARGKLELPARLAGRGRPTQGQVFVPFFDEALLINELTLDAFCPISKQPDYKKSAVRVEKIWPAQTEPAL
ncbi:MAG: molybdopterin-dependent oxidoreductase [Candidatus Latescibacteria bacterium]|nr:molybdopterin-dependent oxidoreductase [Candidatus Latescibacterota bacterium]